MRSKMMVLLGVCLAIASLFLCSASNNYVGNAKVEPLAVHSVDEAFDHALLHIETYYHLHSLRNLEWKAKALGPDMIGTTHYIYISKPETVGELQAQFAINPAHSGFMTEQLTVIVHAPDDPSLSHIVTVIDSESHKVWPARLTWTGM